MLSEGSFPDRLKMAKVLPILKKAPKNDLNSYRPVSILPSFSKIFEKIIYKRFYDFFQSTGRISPSQYGFRPGMSCENALYDAIDTTLKYMDKGEQVAAIMFDLRKAFDTVSHCILMAKLEAYGIRGVALDLMKSYLGGRTQVVVVEASTGDSVISKTCAIKRGIAQGSILGPLLFLVYMDDLTRYLGMGDLFQFADDTTLIIHDKTIDGLSHLGVRALRGMSLWCRYNKMDLNLEKTKLIQFGTRVLNQSLLIRSTSGSLPVSDSARFLGVYVQRSLGWDEHIQHLCAKLSGFYYCIYRLRDSVDERTLRQYYVSCCESVFSYGILIWGSSPLLLKLFKMQKRLVRCMLRLGYRDSCRGHFTELSIFTVPALYIYKLLVYCKQNLHLFAKNEQVSKHFSTRRAKSLSVPRHATSIFEKGPQYMMIRAYNALPDNLIKIVSVNKFKYELKKYLIEKEYYEVKDHFAEL